MSSARAARTARRSAPWGAAALIFALLSLPAFFDLRGLFDGLALIALGFGVVTAAFTWFDRR